MAKGIDFTVYRGSKDGTIIQDTTHRDGLKGDDVLIRVTHSGLCGTDEHYRKSDQVLGHECAGVVEELGPECTVLKMGERVGFGYLHTSCGHCEPCLTGQETFCSVSLGQMYGTGDFDLGSLASHSVHREAFLFQIPDQLESKYAAPLMCGGATVFNALEAYNVRPTERVGVIGVGGLGHMAIQFAAAYGCEVVVFSGTNSKKEEAFQLGATEFYATKDVKELQIERPVNRLLVTTARQPNWALYFSILAPTATVYPLSIDPTGNPLSVPYMPLVLHGIRIQGTIVAARQVHNRMLRFAAEHGIKPMINEFPMTKAGIEEAFEHLNSGRMRYRGVLVA